MTFMSRSTYYRNAWVAALVAAFMVLVLPACWFGALERAVAQGRTAPSSSNNNEEREEHQEHVADVRDEAGRRPPSPPQALSQYTSSRPTVSSPRSIVAVSVAAPVVPSKFSERRLI